MKNAFYVMLKPFFVFEIFTTFFWHFANVEKRFNEKAESILKFMKLHTGQQIITIHILPNISRRKGNQTMEFGQLL